MREGGYEGRGVLLSEVFSENVFTRWVLFSHKAVRKLKRQESKEKSSINDIPEIEILRMSLCCVVFVQIELATFLSPPGASSDAGDVLQKSSFY